MKLHRVLTTTGMARSGAEAQRLIKQGAVWVGACYPDCTFFETGSCTCQGWEKVTNPAEEIEPGWVVKVGNGFYRTVKREGAYGVDQLPGVGRVP